MNPRTSADNDPSIRLVAAAAWRTSSCEVADHDVGVQANHRHRPIRETLLFIASRVTARLVLGIMPLSNRTSRVAGLTMKPASVSTNSTRWPASRPSFVRTAFGRVIWPLLVIVAVATGASLFQIQ